MNNENHETIADIVAEMRKRAEEVYAGQDGYPESWKDQMDYGEIYELADRIEAAHTREIADTSQTSPQRNCDCHFAKNLIGAVTIYCIKNPGLPPMVEWNAIQYLEFCKWLFSEVKED